LIGVPHPNWLSSMYDHRPQRNWPVLRCTPSAERSEHRLAPGMAIVSLSGRIKQRHRNFNQLGWEILALARWSRGAGPDDSLSVMARSSDACLLSTFRDLATPPPASITFSLLTFVCSYVKGQPRALILHHLDRHFRLNLPSKDWELH
jgi:hypothetical protein